VKRSVGIAIIQVSTGIALACDAILTHIGAKNQGARRAIRSSTLHRDRLQANCGVPEFLASLDENDSLYWVPASAITAIAA
jgi:hypothetical protein